MADVKLSELKATDRNITQTKDGVFHYRHTHRDAAGDKVDSTTNFTLSRNPDGTVSLTSLEETIKIGKDLYRQSVFTSGGDEPNNGWTRTPMVIDNMLVNSLVVHEGDDYIFSFRNTDGIPYGFKLQDPRQELKIVLIGQRVVIEAHNDDHPKFQQFLEANDVRLTETFTKAIPQLNLRDLPPQASDSSRSRMRPPQPIWR